VRATHSKTRSKASVQHRRKAGAAARSARTTWHPAARPHESASAASCGKRESNELAFINSVLHAVVRVFRSSAGEYEGARKMTRASAAAWRGALTPRRTQATPCPC
jgi:hypothetical protein